MSDRPWMDWRAATPADRRGATLWAVSAGIVIAALSLAGHAAAWVPECTWRSVTGLPCATCGATRAVVAMSRGDLASAALENPLIAASVLVFVAGGLAAPLWVALARRVPVPRPLPGRTILLVVAGAVAANWAYLLAFRR